MYLWKNIRPQNGGLEHTEPVPDSGRSIKLIGGRVSIAFFEKTLRGF